MSATTEVKQLHDYRNAAEYCGLRDKKEQRYFINQVKAGRGPDYLKLSPRVIRFTTQALDRWMESWQTVRHG
jgi:hypothetical protein